MAAGTWLRLMTAAIGRDPERNPDPDTYSVTRERKEYAAFGGGLHHCLGMHLGKLEAVIALNMLLDRYEDLSLADTPTPATRRGIPGFRGFEHLLVDAS
jgi:cytochrome P450